MKKYLAKMLRRTAQRLDPVEETKWCLLTPTYGVSATNVASSTYEWKAC